MKEEHAATVRTVCPKCECSYQRPVTAKEIMTGGGPESIVCEFCSDESLLKE